LSVRLIASARFRGSVSAVALQPKAEIFKGEAHFEEAHFEEAHRTGSLKASAFSTCCAIALVLR
jgi:hypothetical protein